MKVINESGLLVYIVDDDPMFTKALDTYLKAEFPDIRFRSFQNGEACLKEFHKMPDLILLDYRMDSEFPFAWDGLQVLQRIHTRSPETQVVIISSSESAETAMEFIKNGAYEYLVKNESTFPKVKELLLEMQDSVLKVEDVKINVRRSPKGLIGILLLIMLLILILLNH
jgi:two-component system response regulator AtoC